MDDVYTRICDLTMNEAMFIADLYYHKTCYLECYKSYNDSITNKFNDIAKTSNIETNDIVTAKLIIKSCIREMKHVINHRNGIFLSKISELIQDNENITMHKKLIKSRKTWKKHTVLHSTQKKSLFDESNENNNFESAKEQLNLLQEALASKSPS